MSPFVGNSDEMMNLYPSEEQAEALLRGEDPQDAEMADLVNSLRSLGDRAISDDVAGCHIAMIAWEATISPGAPLEPTRPHAASRARRQVVFSTLLSSMVFRVFAASVAFATLGAGVAIAANGAAPGDPLYGIDRALERVGIAGGGASERADEARSLAGVDLPAAVATAGEAAEAAGNSNAADALAAAALRILDHGDGQVDEIRDAVEKLLDLISLNPDALQGEEFGQAVAAAAQDIGAAVDLPDGVPSGEGPPDGVPSLTVPAPSP